MRTVKKGKIIFCIVGIYSLNGKNDLEVAVFVCCSWCRCLFYVLHLLSKIFLSVLVLVRKGKDDKAEIVIIDHGLYETLQHR